MSTSAWYSSEAADKWGASYWRHVDGHEVLVTGVCNDYGFADKVYVGEVTEFVRHAFDGYRSEELQMDEPYDDDYLYGQYEDYEDYLDEYEDDWVDERDILHIQNNPHNDGEQPEFDWDVGGEA